MLLLSLALAQACETTSAISAFPLGSLPPDSVHWAVAETDCVGVFSARVTLFESDRVVHRQEVEGSREDDFVFFRFEIPDEPHNTELFLDIDVRVDDESQTFLGGYYEVDPTRVETLDGRPQLANLQVERSKVDDGVQIQATAAVLPATSAPEAFLLWRSEGKVRAVTVSTQPSPTLEWTADAPAERVCIEVVEIGVDGSSASSEPRCDERSATTCGCSSAPGAPWWMFVAGRRRG